MLATHPVLTSAESAAWEEKLLGGDETKTWAAMSRAGRGVAEAALKDYLEIRPVPDDFRVLLLLGTGHNAGDALVAGRAILEKLPHASATALLLYPRGKLRPLAKKALDAFEALGDRAETLEWGTEAAKAFEWMRFNLVLEGVVGMQMKPPLRPPAPEIFRIVERMSIEMRAAVDLPAGVGDECAPDGFAADFTYATGIAKRAIFDPANPRKTGRVRYIDIGFFNKASPEGDPSREIILPRSLESLRALRPVDADKRANGHVFIVGGARSMPGAVSMATMAAVRAGAGLVTTFLPESISAAAFPTAPEAMWVPLPIESGDVAGSQDAVEKLSGRMTAMVIGPGLDGGDWNVRDLIFRLIARANVPVVIDASALIPEAVRAADERPESFPPAVFTPHLGELARLVGDKVFQPGCDLDAAIRDFAKEHRAVVLLKGPVTRITDGKRVLCGAFGGPVLGRGGSGDILSGILGALVAKRNANALESAALAALWHGAAAEHLARERGQTAVRTTEILDHLSPALRE
jgi:NAD(P)H-hydrate epimerase